MIFHSGTELVKALNNSGNPELLKEVFYQRAKEWPFHIMHSEITVGTFYDVELNATQSFGLIPAAMELCFEQHDSDLLATALSLLSQCIRMADTTEIPVILSERWRELENKVSQVGNKDCIMYWEGIKKWYRV